MAPVWRLAFVNRFGAVQAQTDPDKYRMTQEQAFERARAMTPVARSLGLCVYPAIAEEQTNE